LTPAALCPDCGAALDAEGEPCLACTAESAPHETAPCEEARANGSNSTGLALLVRFATALLYVGLCFLMLYCSVSFFEDGDWWFGAMGIGLAFIAVLGIKQSLFPKEWTPE
jgi:hypothetical protein